MILAMWRICIVLPFVLMLSDGRSTTAGADCGVVRRAAWGGTRPSSVEYLPRPVGLVIIQHTVTPTCSAHCDLIVRSIQANHMGILGYSDIGPSFLVGSDGAVYEGAGWLHVGAHTYRYNRRSIGIAFIGNYNTDEPTEAALNATLTLLACGVRRGHLRADYALVAHKQLIATESPGTKLYSQVVQWPHWLKDATPLKPHS